MFAKSPADLHDDLRRVAHSNGRVSCEGERAQDRTGLPPAAIRFGKDVRVAIQDALMKVPLQDTTGRQQMAGTTADKLARLVMAGKLDFEEFAKASAEMTGRSMGKSGMSLDAIRDGWALMEPALEELATILVWPELRFGVKLLDKMLTTTARQTNKSAESLLGWAKRVVVSYNIALAKFRMCDGPTASLEQAIMDHDHLYRHDTAITQMRMELLSTPSQPHVQKSLKEVAPTAEADKKRSKLDKDKVKGEGSGLKRQVGSGEAWKQLISKVEKELPNTCRFWLLTKCTCDKGACRKSHERTEAVNKFVAKTAGLSW